MILFLELLFGRLSLDDCFRISVIINALMNIVIRDYSKISFTKRSDHMLWLWSMLWF